MTPGRRNGPGRWAAALSDDLARMVQVYGRRVREGMSLAEATEKLAAYDKRNGQSARAAVWQMER